METRHIWEKLARIRRSRYTLPVIILLYAASVAGFALASVTFTITSPATVNPAPVVSANIACGSTDIACTPGTCQTSGSTVSCTGTAIDAGDTYTITFNLSNFPGSSAAYNAQSSNTSAASVAPASGTVPLTSGSGSASVTVTGQVILTQGTANITVNIT